MFTHWASNKESDRLIDLVQIAFGSWGPKSVCIGFVEEVDICVSISSFRDGKLFLRGQARLRVFVRDLDLDRMRF